MVERFEASRVGRAVLSVFLIVTVLSLVAWNLPPSKLRERSLPAAGRYVNATGLEQNWGVFAPDPRRQTIELLARISYRDGTKRHWRVPKGGPVLDAYADYRWLKWAEWVTNQAYAHLREPAVAWLVRRERDAGRHPSGVELFVRWRELRPPGSEPAEGPWQSQLIYHELVVEQS